MLEAGPDFGSYAGGGWPRDVLDATWLAESHQLGYASDDGYRGRRVEFQRAGMIGGCSSHNGCAAIWGSALDYDALAAPGSRAGRAPTSSRCCAAANERMRVRIPEESELAPFHRAALASLVALGVPRVHDLNDLDADTGVAPVARQHRRRRALERRARLPRPRARARRRCGSAATRRPSGCSSRGGRARGARRAARRRAARGAGRSA